MNRTARDASDTTTRLNRAAAEALALDDVRDDERARRGLVTTPPSLQIPAEEPVWDLGAYDFLADDCPDTVHPSLWRQARLNMNAGLFEVVPGIHQVRGYDYANITFVEGATGWIVIDPLTTRATASAALELADSELGRRPVTAVIYTHSHADHFGGAHGVIDAADAESGDVRVIAPDGFLDAAVSENVIAGNAMSRRAMYMYGPLLPKGPRGHVDAGIGKGLPFGVPGLIAPNEIIDHTGQTLVVDGVPIEFHFTPDAEAPAEMDFLFPEHRALCMAENCVGTMHNLYTPRGAMVRDALSWSKYLNEAIDLFADRADAMFICHHWPVWGRDEIVEHLTKQRDMYRFVHDQTMRLANRGYTMDEIAETVRLPETLRTESTCREYYGTVSHNTKAVYQRYLGWFDANPAHLHRHPPAELGRRYVDAMGGPDAAVAIARRFHDDGDGRFAAELASHVVFADPDNEEAKELLADAFEQLGYQSESAPWRDFYLYGAHELRNGTNAGLGGPWQPGSDVTDAMTVAMLIEYLGVSIDGTWAEAHPIEVTLDLTDEDDHWAIGIANGAIHASQGRSSGAAAPRLGCARAVFASLVVGETSVADELAAGRLQIDGGSDEIAELFANLDRFDRWFDIVTPGEDLAR
ncbi:MAG: MBL fold metallo-hydrolase [Acidimicrobiia bacterium]|nr:MBL fold metallo-hydrolase [Acidimicrobiia bacterium]